MTNLTLLLALAIQALTIPRAVEGISIGKDNLDEEWDLDEPCQSYIQEYATKQSDMVKCAVDHSSPPRVCTNCALQYSAFKEAEYRTHHMDNILTKNNKTCTEAMYSNYLISYAGEVANAVEHSIWRASKCASCLDSHGDPPHGNYSFELNNQTRRFGHLIGTWRDCVNNHTGTQNTCDRCEHSFNQMFDFYWKIYADPAVDFCIDIEATMNATTALWHEVWSCPERHVDRSRDTVVVGFAATVLLIIIGLFYAGSYIQTERERQHLIQYSRLEAPRGDRSRLLSSSTTLDSYPNDPPYSPASAASQG